MPGKPAPYDKTLRRDNVRKMKELGMTYNAIGKLYGVSGTSVYYWLCDGRKSARRVSSYNIDLRSTYLRHRPRNCEVCGRETGRGRGNTLQHHHWDHNHPEVGIWVCSRCHMGVDALEVVPDLQYKYDVLKKQVEAECSYFLKRKE